jgi:malonate-semialdehyde dehydrogenase (acetylating) / methylmalonate-semialdehyde dehydrogenase
MRKTRDAGIATIRHFVGGRWLDGTSGQTAGVRDPATGAVIAQTPLASPAEVDAAVQAARAAFPDWSRTPVGDRVQFLFRMKSLLEAHRGDLSMAVSRECGKTLAEARGEILRAVENIETAAGMPMLMRGHFTENIARGIDEYMIRQPLGVGVCITPFNFPMMIPFWFLPYAIAAGNTYIVKVSERVPMSMQLAFELMEQLELPPGVLNLLHGGRETVEALLDHPDVAAASFVGSTPAAMAVYARGAAAGKRVQCQGGAKNPAVILPDCDWESATRIVADSAFGCAGQRCLASSLAITVGEAEGPFSEAIAAAAATRKVGPGYEEGTDMGAVISADSRDRILGVVDGAVRDGARLLAGGEHPSGLPASGFFVAPTVVGGLPSGHPVTANEIFGPVLTLVHCRDIEEAIAWMNSGRYGNMASVFTNDGGAARRFRSEVLAGNIGINIGVAAPMASYPFSGWKQSFFGDLHAQGEHAVEFFTQTKVVVERWKKEWARKF